MQVLCAGNPEKKALSQQAYGKKRLPTSTHVLFSAPILIARRLRSASRNENYPEE
jgi:hypothetical protein